MKNIKVRTRIILPAILFSAIILLGGCNEEEPLITSIVNFSSDVQHVNEGSKGTFTLQFSQPAPQSGTLRISVNGNALYGEHYTTTPELVDGIAEISVGKGNTTFHFAVFTTDNTFYENSKYITFTMEQIPARIERGVHTRHTVIIDDDEAPSTADFQEMYLMVDEKNADGVNVKIRLSRPVQGAGAIAVDLVQNPEPGLAVYDKHFTTLPAATQNRIMLGAVQGDTLLSFKIIPVDNALFEEDKLVQFRLSSFTGAVQKGDYTTCQIIIRSDDTSAAAFDNNDVIIDEDDYKGIVVKVTLSKPIPMESRLNVIAGFIPYGVHFVTDPDLQFTNAPICDPLTEYCEYERYYFLPLTLHPNSTSAEFRIMPVNNQAKDGHQVYYISLVPLHPYITTSHELKLTILDDD